MIESNASNYVWGVQEYGRTMWIAEGVPGLFVDKLRAEGAWIAVQRRKAGTQSPADAPALRRRLKLS